MTVGGCSIPDTDAVGSNGNGNGQLLDFIPTLELKGPLERAVPWLILLGVVFAFIGLIRR